MVLAVPCPCCPSRSRARRQAGSTKPRARAGMKSFRSTRTRANPLTARLAPPRTPKIFTSVVLRSSKRGARRESASSSDSVNAAQTVAVRWQAGPRWAPNTSSPKDPLTPRRQQVCTAEVEYDERRASAREAQLGRPIHGPKSLRSTSTGINPPLVGFEEQSKGPADGLTITRYHTHRANCDERRASRLFFSSSSTDPDATRTWLAGCCRCFEAHADGMQQAPAL